MAGSIVKAVASAPPEIEYVSVEVEIGRLDVGDERLVLGRRDGGGSAAPLEVITGALFPLPHSTPRGARRRFGIWLYDTATRRAPSERRTSALPLTQPGRFTISWMTPMRFVLR